ncbi:MAG TPA: hypothetical protein VFW33_10950, partial [Gemmataceae bacterium]|nr:hypothetical protein [Gemmataceae bacterium]
MRYAWTVALLALGALAWAPGRAEEKKGTTVEIAGFKSKVPGDWKPVELTEQQKNFGRIYQFDVPKAKDDKHDAEMYVFYFKGSGGDAKANIDRWKSQFTAPEKGKVESKVEEIKVGDTPVTYADIRGTYKFKKNAFNPNEKEELRPAYRLIGVIFESKKEGSYFIRFVGPAKTVEANKKAFDEWL